MISTLDLAWATGLFEGEGSIRINKPTKRNCGTLVVSVVNTDVEVIEFFASRWSGYFKRATGLDPTRQKPAWVWVIAARRAASFLREIRPHVVRAAVRQKIDHGSGQTPPRICGVPNSTDGGCP